MTTLTRKQISYLKRYAAAGLGGTRQGWSSGAVPQLLAAGYLENVQRRVTLRFTRITDAGLKALAENKGDKA